MKIAILTLPLHSNYGGILQAYALREYLLQKGHEVYHVEESGKQSVVNWSNLRFNSWWYARRLLRQILTLNLDKKRAVENMNRFNLRKNTSDIRRFFKNNIEFITVENFKELASFGFDMIVVGSDQIWRPLYYKSIEDAFLSFAEDWKVKKVSYAPSFGVEHWEFTKSQTKRCAQLLENFDAVSVREDEGVNLCKKKFNVNAIRLLDPTMLLDQSAYEKLVGRNVKTVSKQLTTYILDENENKKQIIDSLLSGLDLNITSLSLTNKGQSKANLENWLKQFMQAEFIFTDSFHGCVFAILFQKPFIAYGNKDRGVSRFNTLLRLFELEDRVVQSNDNITDLMNREIDWSRVEEILFSERYKSSSFFNELDV